MNAAELSNILSEQINKLRTGKVDPKVSNAIASMAAKILSTQRLSIEYAKITGQLPHIPFLTGPKRAEPLAKPAAKLAKNGKR